MNAPDPRRSIIPAQRYKIGDYLVDFPLHSVGREGIHARISPKAASVLRELVSKRGQPISRDALLDNVWNRISASDELLTQAIKELRRAFADDPKNPVYIETIPKSGYRLIASAIPYVSAELNAPLKPVDTAHKFEVVGSTPVRPENSRRWRVGVVALAILAIVAILGGVYFWRTLPNREQAPIHTQGLSLTTGIDQVAFAAISPNGAFVAYSRQPSGSNGAHIYVATTAGAAAQQLTSVETIDTYPVWSSDGSMLAFLRFDNGECHIELIAATGGDARSIGTCMSYSLSYFDWAPDGKSLIMETADMEQPNKVVLTLHKMNLEDGVITPLAYERSANEHDVEPRFSPDGKSIAFRRGANPYSDIYVIAAAGGPARRLTSVHAHISGFDWMPDNRHIVFSSSHEGKQRLYLLDVANLAVRPTDAEDMLFPRVARSTNRIATVRDNNTVNLCEYPIAQAAGKATCNAIAPSVARDQWPLYAPDGQSMCFVSNRTGFSQLWLLPAGKKEPVQLTSLETGETLSNPQWSADGREILVVASRQASSRLLAVDHSSQQMKQLSKGTENVRFGKYAPQGDYLYFVSDRGKSWQLWKRQLSTGAESLVVAESVLVFEFSGDGREIFFTQDNYTGLFRLTAQGSVERVSNIRLTAANSYSWQIAGEGIYYLDPEPSGSIDLMLLADPGQKAVPLLTFDDMEPLISISMSPDRKSVVLPQLLHVASTVTLLKLDSI